MRDELTVKRTHLRTMREK